MKYCFILLCLFGLLNPVRGNGNLIVDHYSTDDGLAHETVNCVLQSSDGFLWFGTWYGLCSFDGMKFRTYNSRNKFQADIPPRKIQDILEDCYGNLWIKTTDHKIYLFDMKNEQFHAIFNWLPRSFSLNSQIIKITETKEGNFLLLTKNKDLLMATPIPHSLAEIRLLHKSTIQAGDSRLRHNIFSEDEDYIYWIGMDYSILSVRKGEKLKQNAAGIMSQISNENFLSCRYDDNERLWLLNDQGVLFIIQLAEGTLEQQLLLRGRGEITHIISGEENFLYVVIKGKGLYKLDVTANTLILVSEFAAGITDIHWDEQGLLWLVTDDNRLLAFHPDKKSLHTFYLEEGESVNESIIWKDAGTYGMILISSAGFVYQIDRGQMEMNAIVVDPAHEQLKRLKFSDCHFNERGILWLTSYDNGIYQVSFPGEKFRLMNPMAAFHPLADADRDQLAVKTLFKSKNNEIWVSNRAEELFLFNRDGTLKQAFTGDTYRVGNVYHIMEDREGRLWFSTKGKGLVRAIPDPDQPTGYRFSRYLNDPDNENSISHNDVYYSFQDSHGRIWVATFGGGLNLIQEEEGRVIFRHKYNSFSGYPEFGQYMEVRNIIEDEKGRIWVGTTDGLLSFDADVDSPAQISFEQYQHDGNISNNDVYNLYKDQSGEIWMSVFGVGLIRLHHYDEMERKPVFKTYGTDQGLNSDVILSIIEDKLGNLWLSTEKGVSRFNLREEVFRNFDKYDGLDNYSMEEASTLLLGDGTIWFGCKEGVVYFSPDEIKDDTVNYPTFIVDMVVSNKKYDEWRNDSLSVKYLKKVTLEHHQSMFSIEFAALNYYSQSHVRYRYILEGYEKEWHLADRNRVASYTNVPPGSYLFRVQAMDDTNPTLSSGTSLEIRIKPPWWKSPLAYVLYSLIFLVLLYFILRFVFLMIKMKNDVYIEHKLSELKIKFFTNISHELRTPLTLIKGPIQELREHESLSDKGGKYLNLMEKNTNYMLDLVNQILDFRKVENKKMRLHISPVQVNEILLSLHDDFISLAEEKKISFDYHLLEEELLVWADKEKLEIVVRNILSNAFKFTPAGGRILLTCGTDKDHQRCFIRIEDTGIGIPQSKLGEIFDRFSQNSYYPGTGIGLAFSRELISLHHGTIKVESQEDKGSVFTVEIPLGKDHFDLSKVDFYMDDLSKPVSSVPAESSVYPVAENDKDPVVDRGTLPSLLLIEDNRSLCDMLRMQLEDQFNVDVAYDGVEGLKKVRLNNPDIVVTDQMMPSMSGTELLTEIRNDFQISHIPVVMLTAKDDDDFRVKAIQLGVNAYITKPFHKKHLVARIEQLLNEQRLFRERLRNREHFLSENGGGYNDFLIQKDMEFINHVTQIIEENIDNSEFNIDTIASSLNISRSAFFKKLKSITGLAPVDFVKEIRLSRSLELIKTTDLTVSEIAFAVGFRDSGYFGKCFRKKYGLTPREWMSQYRNGSI